ncbi:hypothetical protein BC830DRAFT_1088723 [Chytriomyces sp. MP71]|nr:hypothetical protein BC830DRAFT_1088723 [Chytriomyces sp. MP71]
MLQAPVTRPAFSGASAFTESKKRKSSEDDMDTDMPQDSYKRLNMCSELVAFFPTDPAIPNTSTARQALTPLPHHQQQSQPQPHAVQPSFPPTPTMSDAWGAQMEMQMDGIDARMDLGGGGGRGECPYCQGGSQGHLQHIMMMRSGQTPY